MSTLFWLILDTKGKVLPDLYMWKSREAEFLNEGLQWGILFLLHEVNRIGCCEIVIACSVFVAYTPSRRISHYMFMSRASGLILYFPRHLPLHISPGKKSLSSLCWYDSCDCELVSHVTKRSMLVGRRPECELGLCQFLFDSSKVIWKKMNQGILNISLYL